MKVAELTGAELDKWVAKAEGYDKYDIEWHYSYVNWIKAGPIIEREKISIEYDDVVLGEKWCAWINGKKSGNNYGSTALEAAMRCYVVSKFGDEVADS